MDTCMDNNGWVDGWVRGWMCHGVRYITHFYCIAVEAGFCSDVVECLRPGFDSWLGQIVCMDGCMDGITVVWMDGCVDGWMDAWIHGWMPACI